MSMEQDDIDRLGATISLRATTGNSTLSMVSNPLRVRGVFRDAGDPRGLTLHFDRPLTDDDVRRLHHFLRGADL